MKKMKLRTQLSQADIDAFAPDSKVGLLATIDSEGLPHITLITTLAGKDPTHLTWGQFCEGRSKVNVQHEPRVGFLVLNQEREVWRGRARWTHLVGGEPDELTSVFVPSAAPPPASGLSERVAELEERVARLEDTLARAGIDL